VRAISAFIWVKEWKREEAFPMSSRPKAWWLVGFGGEPAIHRPGDGGKVPLRDIAVARLG
jgi:hypothetical protein